MVKVEPLSVEGFRPFGDVVSAGLVPGQSANQGTATRFDWCTELVNTRSSAKANVSVFRSEAKTLPFSVQLLEKHPCSTQAFLPLQCMRYLVVVAPTAADGRFDLTGLRAFVCLPGQGVNYRVGTWHHPIVALDAPADFVMIAHEDRSALDCVLQKLEKPIRVEE